MNINRPLSSEMHHYDILIVGGGLVGTTLALGLSRLSLKVGLVDSTLKNEAHKMTDGRTIALSATSYKILEALSSLNSTSENPKRTLTLIDKLKAHPIETIHISEQKRFAMTRLKASD